MLPELPKIKKRIEADIDTPVLEWFSKNYPRSVAVEVKLKGGKIEKHQPAALKKVANDKFYYKIPDLGHRNPFDGIVLKNADAFVVWYNADTKECVACDINGVEKIRFNL